MFVDLIMLISKIRNIVRMVIILKVGILKYSICGIWIYVFFFMLEKLIFFIKDVVIVLIINFNNIEMECINFFVNWYRIIINNKMLKFKFKLFKLLKFLFFFFWLNF